jgi:hypothetical protein
MQRRSVRFVDRLRRPDTVNNQGTGCAENEQESQHTGIPGVKALIFG